MKAIIMAGGEGSRLRPLTCDCPKPMVPLMDKPLMSYALELLRRHGVREAAVTLHYLPNRVKDYFGDGSEQGMALRYYVEREPLGTAGSVAQAKDFLTETFVVLSGDGVTDCDLSEALTVHRARKAAATIVLKRVENPLEYGVVMADAHGRVKKFVEKPNWGEVFSDTVNTGIYILEPRVLSYVPEGVPFDFSKELFPKLMQEGLPVCAYNMSGYWCDVGDVSAYLRVHADAMDGKINLPIQCRSGGVVRSKDAHIGRGAVLEGPCFIGTGVLIGDGAKIGAYSVIGDGCVIGDRADVKKSVLWRNARMEREAQARGCVLMEDSHMGEGSGAFEESVLGGGAHLGQGSTLLPAVKVWPRKCVADNMRLDANLVWGGAQRPCFHEGRLLLGSPAQATRLAQAYASAVAPKNVLIGRAASSVALSCSMAVQSGLMAQGVQVFDAGIASLPQLRVMCERLRTGGAIYVDGEAMRPLDGQGAELKGAWRRRIEGLLLRQDFERAFAAVTKLPVNAGRADLLYTGYLLEHADEEGLAAASPRVAVCAPTEQLLSAAECVLEKAGCRVRAEWEDELMELSDGEIGVWLTEGGEGMRPADEDGTLTESECMMLRVWTMLEQGEKRIVLPVGATRSAEALAAGYRAQIVRVKGERAHLMHALIEENRHQFMMLFDGLYAALNCLGMLTRKGITLTQWKRRMPRMSRRTSAVDVEWKDKGRILASLLAEEADADMTDGMSICRDGAWAWISPSEELAQCRIVTEAESAEAARELCDFYEGKIRGLTRADRK